MKKGRFWDSIVNTMRIAQVVCVFPPYSGGIGNSVYFLAKKFSSSGEEIAVFTPDYGLPREVSEDGEDFQIKRIKPLFKFGNAACLPQLLWQLRKFDTIHLHLPFLGGTLPALLFLYFHSKKKLIITYHMDLVGRGGKRIIFLFYKKIIVPLALRRADKIIVSSYDYAENSDIKNFFEKHRDKFLEIPFAVDEHKFYPKEKNASLLEKYFIGANDKVILFVGGLDSAHYFKGLDILMRSMKQAADAGQEDMKLLVVGDGGLKADFQDKAERLHLGGKIIFAGRVADAELVDYYNLADIFVLPSIGKSEAFGIVLLEAAACGKPCIASNLAGVRKVVKNNETGFLAAPNDAPDLAEKMTQLLADDELRKKMGEAARQMVLKKYVWAALAPSILNVCRG